MDAQAIQSPFLPDTKIQFAWDSTSLGYIKTCPRLYQYIMLEGWGSSEESIHLRFGIEYHQALQDYDKLITAGANHNEALREVLRELLIRTAEWRVDETIKAGKYKNRSSLVRAVLWYLEEHKDDPAKTVILNNGQPAVELSFRFELEFGPNAVVDHVPIDRGDIEIVSNQPYILCGHLDRVVTFNDAIFVMDHKTTTSTPGAYYFDQWQPNNQMTLYTLASQIILDSPVKGVIINAAQLLIDGARFVRGFTYRTPDQLDEWLYDLRYTLALAETYAQDNYWPQNDTACDKFGGCRFREVCSKSPQVREQFLKARFTKLPENERWNPLKSRS